MSERGEVAGSFRIDIGPLRARWRGIGLGFLWLCVPMFAAAFMLQQTRLDCVRELGKAPRCVLSDSPPLPHVERYAPGAIGAIDVVPRGSRGGKYWEVMILDIRGAERAVASDYDQAVAEAFATRLRAFLADPRALRFSFVPAWHWQVLLRALLYVAFGVCMFLFLLWHGLRDAGHLLVDIDRAHGELRVRRRLFGISHGKQARYPLSELQDIELEHGSVRDNFAPRGQLPEKGARLIAVRNSGHRFPLTPTFLPSPQLFETGLELLRVELGFAIPEPAQVPAEQQEQPEERDQAERPSASSEGRAPRPGLADRMRAFVTAAKRSQHARAWLLGIGVVVVWLAAGVISSWRAATTEGQLELRAEYRCRFDGMDLLPGGVTTTSLAPGLYEVRVFDTAVAGGWQAQHFRLRAGESKLVICRPVHSKSR